MSATYYYRVAIFSAVISLWSGASHSGTTNIFGEWLVESTTDPFSPRKKTIAINPEGGHALAIRCMDDGLSALLVIKTRTDEKYRSGAEISYKYRADAGDIKDLTGVGFIGDTIILSNARDVLNDALKAKELAFRAGAGDGSIITVVFKMRGSAKALAAIKTDCATD